ncbi:hypothetical protein CA85_17900 [Allorhodopirellula solitaria]|uniref:Uncharacterized protein n=1 Tax=Allorhodopirellula solitaria TaxID=2527987 RepID=A0A5C5YFQ7_9BACT|nr:hypothetical protein CA85_17900 [Allorhodopirellula solitaria]
MLLIYDESEGRVRQEQREDLWLIRRKRALEVFKAWLQYPMIDLSEVLAWQGICRSTVRQWRCRSLADIRSSGTHFCKIIGYESHA